MRSGTSNCAAFGTMLQLGWTRAGCDKVASQSAFRPRRRRRPTPTSCVPAAATFPPVFDGDDSVTHDGRRPAAEGGHRSLPYVWPRTFNPRRDGQRQLPRSSVPPVIPSFNERDVLTRSRMRTRCGTKGDQASRAYSCSRIARISLRSWESFSTWRSIFSIPCMMVLWSRPPNS